MDKRSLLADWPSMDKDMFLCCTNRKTGTWMRASLADVWNRFEVTRTKWKGLALNQPVLSRVLEEDYLCHIAV